jgi:rubrerythrin
MLEQTRVEAAAEDFVHLATAGERAKGEYRCAECGYGVAVWSELPTCPMCGGETWEQSAWSPFSRSERL